MLEEIKFKSRSERIDYLLSCLSGIIQSPYSKMYLLVALFKEINHEITTKERTHIIQLFNDANNKNNMVYMVEGWGRGRNYQHKEEFLNEIELYLRVLLSKYKHYSLQTEKIDYQIGEK